MHRFVFVGVFLAAGAFFGARYAASRRRPAMPPRGFDAPTTAVAAASGGAAGPPELLLHVPHVQGNLVLDGDMDDPAWLGKIARTGGFLDEDEGTARPYSDARALWGDGYLYLGLYAADENVQTSVTRADVLPEEMEDAFYVTFRRPPREWRFVLTPNGILADGQSVDGGPIDYAWQSGAHVSRELDGTINNPRDNDEEWIIEMAIPFSAFGLNGEPGERIGFGARRCDTPKKGPRGCGEWGRGGNGVLVLDR